MKFIDIIDLFSKDIVLKVSGFRVDSEGAVLPIQLSSGVCGNALKDFSELSKFLGFAVKAIEYVDEEEARIVLDCTYFMGMYYHHTEIALYKYKMDRIDNHYL